MRWLALQPRRCHAVGGATEVGALGHFAALQKPKKPLLAEGVLRIREDGRGCVCASWPVWSFMCALLLLSVPGVAGRLHVLCFSGGCSRFLQPLCSFLASVCSGTHMRHRVTPGTPKPSSQQKGRLWSGSSWLHQCRRRQHRRRQPRGLTPIGGRWRRRAKSGRLAGSPVHLRLLRDAGQQAAVCSNAGGSARLHEADAEPDGFTARGRHREDEPA